MTDNQQMWAQARDRLAIAASSLGYPEELADALAKQLHSLRAIDRMTAYLYQAHPRSLETIMDEMLAIRADIDAWQGKKKSESSQADVTVWLNSKERRKLEDQD